MGTNLQRPNLPLKVRLAISLFSAARDAAHRGDGTINRRLLYLFNLLCVSPNPVPVGGIRTIDITINPSHNLWIRLFIPNRDIVSHQRFSLIVYFHGGGFTSMSPDNRVYDAVCRRIARKIQAVVASVNYRLASEHRYPAPYEDGVDVLKFIDSGGIENVAGELVDLSSCFLIGDSAGGNIVHHVVRRCAAEVGGWIKVKLLGIVLIQPFFGGEERTESEVRLIEAPLISSNKSDRHWRAFLPLGADRDHEAANVFGPKSLQYLDKSFPPAMVVVGGYDPLQDWQRRYCDALRAREREVRLVEFAEAIHSFFVFPEIVDGDKMIAEMGSFLKSCSVVRQSFCQNI